MSACPVCAGQHRPLYCHTTARQTTAHQRSLRGLNGGCFRESVSGRAPHPCLLFSVPAPSPAHSVAEERGLIVRAPAAEHVQHCLLHHACDGRHLLPWDPLLHVLIVLQSSSLHGQPSTSAAMRKWCKPGARLGMADRPPSPQHLVRTDCCRLCRTHSYRLQSDVGPSATSGGCDEGVRVWRRVQLWDGCPPAGRWGRSGRTGRPGSGSPAPTTPPRPSRRCPTPWGTACTTRPAFKRCDSGTALASVVPQRPLASNIHLFILAESGDKCR